METVALFSLAVTSSSSAVFLNREMPNNIAKPDLSFSTMPVSVMRYTYRFSV